MWLRENVLYFFSRSKFYYNWNFKKREINFSALELLLKDLYCGLMDTYTQTMPLSS